MDNNMMMQMMQMMMQQNQLMTQMMMQQMQQGQPAQIPTTETPTVYENDTSEVAALKAELDKMKADLAAAQSRIKELTTDLAAEKQTHEATKKALTYERETNRASLKEFANLKKQVGKAEEFLGNSLDYFAEQGRELSGDDYYEEHKQDMDAKGLTNMEKHDEIKRYRDRFTEEEEKSKDPFGDTEDLIDF